jgi:ankyrin repeat protein
MSHVRNFDELEREFYAIMASNNEEMEEELEEIGEPIDRIGPIEALLQRGLFLNAMTARGESLIHAACRYNRLDVARYLVGTKGASTESCDTNGQRPLHTACRVAGFTRVTKTVQYLVEEAGVDLEATTMPPTDSSHGSYNQKTALHMTCDHDHDRKLVMYLVRHGANLEAQDSQGCTPLHLAARKGDYNLVYALLNAAPPVLKGMVDARNNVGSTPLALAAAHGGVRMMTLLIENGADPKGCTMKLTTPLHTACYNGNVSVVEYLLSLVVHAPPPFDDGDGDVELSRSEVNAQDSAGRTPLYLSSNLEVIQMLQREQADPTIAAGDGSTLMHKIKVLSVAKYVVEEWSDTLHPGGCMGYQILTATDRNGQTPLDLAQIKMRRGLKVGSADHDYVKYLLSFSKRQLAVAPLTDGTDGRKRRIAEPSMVMNSKLTDFQRAFAERIRDILDETPALHEVKYMIMGYLSPLDVMNELYYNNRKSTTVSQFSPVGNFGA